MLGIDILATVPMGLLFVFVFGILPIANTIRKGDVRGRWQWILFGLIANGAFLTWFLSSVVGRSRFNIWISLGLMTLGFLLYMNLMRDRGKLHEEPSMGGTSYE